MKILSRFNLEDRFSIDDIDEKLDIFRKYQHYFYSGFILIVSLQILFTMTIPSYQFYTKDSKSIDQYSKILAMRKNQLSNTENLQKELEQLNVMLEEKKQSFFSFKEVEQFSISHLPKIAEKLDIKVTSMKFSQATADAKGMTSHPINLTIETSFSSLMAFFYKLEQDSKSILIKDVRIRRKSVDPVELSVTVLLELFSLKGVSS